MAASAPSLHVYRQLLRSVNQAFKGDTAMIAGAYQEIRTKFEESRRVTDSEQLKELQAQGQEAASFIQSAVVQAAINDSGNLEMVVQSEHHGTYAEPVVPGMDLPKEKKKKKSD